MLWSKLSVKFAASYWGCEIRNYRKNLGRNYYHIFRIDLTNPCLPRCVEGVKMSGVFDEYWLNGKTGLENSRFEPPKTFIVRSGPLWTDDDCTFLGFGQAMMFM